MVDGWRRLPLLPALDRLLPSFNAAWFPSLPEAPASLCAWSDPGRFSVLPLWEGPWFCGSEAAPSPAPFAGHWERGEALARVQERRDISPSCILLCFLCVLSYVPTWPNLLQLLRSVPLTGVTVSLEAKVPFAPVLTWS